MLNIQWQNDQYSIRAEIYPFGIDDRTTIRVNRHESDFGSKDWDTIPEINWPSIGAQNIKISEQFANGLLKAVEIAKEIAGPAHQYQVKIIFKEKEHEVIRVGNNEKQVRESLFLADKIITIEEMS